MKIRNITEEQWHAEGVKRFGPDMLTWLFVCPSCGHIASVQDYKNTGASSGAVGFSCIGRFLPKPEGGCKEAFGGLGSGPCNYAGGGLIRLNPVHVKREDGSVIEMMEFADAAAGVVPVKVEVLP